MTVSVREISCNKNHQIAVFSFVVLSILILTWQLLGEQYLRGPDAYYYALQADYWASTGNVKIPDSSFVHRAVGLLQLSGLDTESAIKVWMAIVLLIVSGLVLFLNTSPLGSLYTVVVGCWLLISPSLLFVAIEFPKLFSLFLLVPVVFYLLRQRLPVYFLSVMPLGLMLFVHKAAIPIVGIWGAGLIYRSLRLLKNMRFILLAIFVSSCLAAVYLSFGDRFHVLDLSRLGGWNNLSPGVITLLGRTALPLAIKVELILSLAVFVTTLYWYVKSEMRKWSVVILSLAPVIPGLFPFSGDEVFGVGERYAVLLPFLSVTSCLFLLGNMGVHNNLHDGRKIFFILPVLGLSVIWRLQYSHPVYLDPDNAKYDRLAHVLDERNIPMLIVHRGFNFYYKFITHREAFHYEPEAHWNKKLIWRLAYGIAPEEFDYYLPKKCGWQSDLIQNIGDPEYFLIREDCWSAFRKAVKYDENQDLYLRLHKWWRNPAQLRPRFLYLKHKNEPGIKDDPFPAFPG